MAAISATTAKLVDRRRHGAPRGQPGIDLVAQRQRALREGGGRQVCHRQEDTAGAFSPPTRRGRLATSGRRPATAGAYRLPRSAPKRFDGARHRDHRRQRPWRSRTGALTEATPGSRSPTLSAHPRAAWHVTAVGRPGGDRSASPAHARKTLPAEPFVSGSEAPTATMVRSSLVDSTASMQTRRSPSRTYSCALSPVAAASARQGGVRQVAQRQVAHRGGGEAQQSWAQPVAAAARR